jgi:hypothetical protein
MHTRAVARSGDCDLAPLRSCATPAMYDARRGATPARAPDVGDGTAGFSAVGATASIAVVRSSSSRTATKRVYGSDSHSGDVRHDWICAPHVAPTRW